MTGCSVAPIEPEVQIVQLACPVPDSYLLTEVAIPEPDLIFSDSSVAKLLDEYNEALEIANSRIRSVRELINE